LIDRAKIINQSDCQESTSTKGRILLLAVFNA